jgi:hypothetical protein
MRKKFVTFVWVVVLIGIGATILLRQIRHVNGRYVPDTKWGLQNLRTIADNSHPLRDALERFKSDSGNYPATVTNLFPSCLQASNAPDGWNTKDWAGWEYHPQSTNGYELFYQLDWDGGLWFEHSFYGTNQWSWSSSSDVVDLTQKFQEK